MNGYFKPLRRKVGVITLELALTILSLYFRSQNTVDVISVSHFRSDSVFASGGRGFFLCLGSHLTDIYLNVRENTVWVSMIDDDTPKLNGVGKLKWTSRGATNLQISWSGGSVENRRVVSYFWIVIPLTLLSAWLLLSRPRAPKPISIPKVMTMNSSTKGNPREPGETPLAQYVRKRLPKSYMIQMTDVKWLDLCDGFLSCELTNESVVEATKAALKAHPTGHVDPFELLIDGKICDTNCDPRPEKA